MVVEGGVPHERLHPVEIAVVLPGDETLIVQAVRKIGGFQDARGVLEDAVLDVLKAVLDLLDGVLPMEEPCDLLLVVVLLALGLGEAVVPGAELFLRDNGGIPQVQGVDPGPVQAVAGRLQGIDDETVGEGILDGHVVLIQERIRQTEAVRHLHRIPRVHARSGVDGFLFHAEEIEVVVRKVLDDGFLFLGGGFHGVEMNGVLRQRVKTHFPQEPHAGVGPDRPGGLHPDRPDDRQPGDDSRYQYFGPQILHQPTKIRIISGIQFSPFFLALISFLFYICLSY